MKQFAKCLLFALVSVLSCAGQYSVRIIDCPGADRTRLNGINNNGVVVGSFRLPGVPQQAMVYRNGRCESLQPMIGSGFSVANGVNDRGDVVGTYDGHAFILKDGQLTLFDFPDAAATTASAINEAGEVVGYYTEESGALKAFRRSPEGELSALTLPFTEVVDSLATGINSRGDIVGDWDSDPTTLGHGWIRKKNGVMITFDVPGAPVNGTFGAGINDRGDIVGTFGQIGGVVQSYVLIDDAVQVIDSGIPGFLTVANAINNQRYVVGTVHDGLLRHGFLAVPR